MFVCVVWYLILHVFLFFFFKQKTAYEMRISDWSSDVCSSDLACAPKVAAPTRAANRARDSILFLLIDFDSCSGHRTRGREAISVRRAPAGCLGGRRRKEKMGPQRSEEHTSELQSLMRSSYAVFCLNKKISNHTTQLQLVVILC